MLWFSIKRLESEGLNMEKEEAEAKTKMKSITMKKIKLLREMKDNIKVGTKTEYKTAD